ncbi:predicted protein [Sclerotinia sclerotiorum 1980 UF-70]|uniref:Uncharacterized protein n=1 Tax=Sclerotinia sclerotiorum (strain ATCC 18683 / 1980 / Ss-1) TaxID=665079 RepID=A7F635_SCLS1|nr:predicted protein [Sclerotinia sclerotiorum 1980 UF-70]EDN98206.1 predicted protein [Sclerotinia sclerotiorum 1980 UF-70]
MESDCDQGFMKTSDSDLIRVDAMIRFFHRGFHANNRLVIISVIKNSYRDTTPELIVVTRYETIVRYTVVD